MANMGKNPPRSAPKEPVSSNYPTETDNSMTPSNTTVLPSDSSVLPSDYYDPNETDYPYDPDYYDEYYETIPPPIRDPRTGHHHNPIKVTSETDLAAMHINEKKVNILPYYPATATSQTGLIQSIGKPFNPNHAKNLPAPGEEFMINRRVSQVRLGQIRLLGKVNIGLMETLVGVIKLCAILIGVAGILFFVFVVYTMVAPTPFEYFHYFLDNNPWWKLSYIVAVIQPIVVAPYCRYALVNLKHLRMYYFRVPLTFLFPASLSICSSMQVAAAFDKPDAPGSLDWVMKKLMAKYYDRFGFLAKFSWDTIHNWFKCCGYDGPEDWKDIRPFNPVQHLGNDTSSPATLPTTCCKEDVDPCTIGLDEVKETGCKDSYKATTLTIAFVYLILPLIIIGIELVSVICMKMLHAVVRKELYDERKALTVMCGNICSMCTIVDTDEELEYGEQKQEPDEFEKPPEKKKGDMGKADKANKPDEPKPAVTMPEGRDRGRGKGRGNPPGKFPKGPNKVGPAPPNK